MGFIGSFLGKVAGEAVNKGAEVAKQKIADNRAAKEALEAEKMLRAKYKGAAFRLPQGFCDGANGKVWRVKDVNGYQLLLHRKPHGRPERNIWFHIDDIESYYEEG